MDENKCLNAFREKRPANANTLCYNCHERGHYSANCPKPQRPLRSPSSNSSQGTYGNNISRKGEYHIPPKTTTQTDTTQKTFNTQDVNQMRINRVNGTV